MFLIMLSVWVVLVDQWSKAWVVARLSLHESKWLIPKVLKFQYVKNHGAAMGVFKTKGNLLVLVNALLMTCVWVFIWVSYTTQGYTGQAFALSALLGGGFANVLDRIKQGYVVDFIWFYGFKKGIFNVADVVIVFSAVSYLTLSLV